MGRSRASMKSCWQRSSKQVGIDSDGKGGVSDYDGEGREGLHPHSARINRLSYVFIRKFISPVHMCRRLNTMGRRCPAATKVAQRWNTTSTIPMCQLVFNLWLAGKNIGPMGCTRGGGARVHRLDGGHSDGWNGGRWGGEERVWVRWVGQITRGRVGRSPLFRNNDRSASYARYEYWRVNAMKGKYLGSRNPCRVDRCRCTTSIGRADTDVHLGARYFADCCAHAKSRHDRCSIDILFFIFSFSFFSVSTDIWR